MMMARVGAGVGEDESEDMEEDWKVKTAGQAADGLSREPLFHRQEMTTAPAKAHRAQKRTAVGQP